MGYLFKRSAVVFALLVLCPIVFAKAIIDADVLKEFKSPKRLNASLAPTRPVSILVFLNNMENKKLFLEEIKQLDGLTIQDLGFMPAVAIQIPRQQSLLKRIANANAAAQISSYKWSEPELEITAQALKLAPSSFYPDINNWWAHGYTGKKGVVGIIDTGVDPLHPALAGKKLIVRQDGYSEHFNGVKAPHATGVACIYASNHDKYKGMAYEVPTIISGFSGEETADPENILMTIGTLDWMLTKVDVKPTLINYSMGNGKLDVNCPNCPEWSGLAKVMDYVVNTKKILWVKSAGNAGYVAPTNQIPFASTLTVPGDNYNGLTIANMNTRVMENNKSFKTAEREKHLIKNTSSRGPTPFGRRKPDLTAPGHDTITCAPDPQVYNFNYTNLMDYKDGYRLMGGTSAAAPHVGGAALLLQDAGIENPMAIKALLINSADTWTDGGTEDTGHSEIMGSAWNRTYGWGYINMEKAFLERKNIVEGELTVANPIWEYRTVLKRGEKVTLVHERRVGYKATGEEWKLSHLTLILIDADHHQMLDTDSSAIDTVHQVANCKRGPKEKLCSKESKTINALIRVVLLDDTLDGSINEPFVLVIP